MSYLSARAPGAPAEPVAARPLQLRIVLGEGGCQFTLACAIEPLRLANRAAGRRLFGWEICGGGAASVALSGGLVPALGRPGEAAPRERPADVELRLGPPEVGIAAARGVDLAGRRGTEVAGALVALIGARHGAALATRVADGLGLPATICLVPPEAVKGRPRPADPVTARLVAAIAAALGEAPDLPRLSARAGLSVRQIERLFRRHLDETPVAFWRRLQVEEGLRLLADGELEVAEVARRCGFASAAAFSRRFRRQFGRSPHAPPRELP